MTIQLAKLYGLSVHRHENACVVRQPSETEVRSNRRAAIWAEVRYVVGQSVLFGAAVTCFTLPFWWPK